MDVSRALDMAGIKTTIIYAGDRKIDGNSFQPLSARARDDVQGDVDQVYGQFLAHVARGRGVGLATVRNDFGQGRSLFAREAVRVGLADRIATPEQAISGALSSASPSQAADTASQSGGGAIAPPLSAAGEDDLDARRRRLRLEALR